MSGSWTKGRDHFFQCETWSLNYEWYWEIAIWSCTDTLYFRLRAEKMFYIKILLILPSLCEKTLSCSGNIKIFPSREEDVQVHSPPIYGRSVKWRKTINEISRNIPGGNFLGGNFPADNFPGGIWWVGIFLVGSFPEEFS